MPTTTPDDAPARSSSRAPRAPARATAKTGQPDAACAAAVDLAREAAQQEAGAGNVGEHLGVAAEGDRTATHSFASLTGGYRGWRWAVTVARAPRARNVTVSEVVLLPDTEAVLAPRWLPWSDRIAPGDLGAGDALPYRGDDPYLEPGWQATGDEDADRLAVWELGLGRVRVLSPEGRAAAAERWYTGDRGPTAEEAQHATAPCSTCAYFLPLAGALRQVFGACANEWSPSEARVVSVDHGCGAHSETDVESPEVPPLPEPILDDTELESVVLSPDAGQPDAGQPDAGQPEAAQPEVAQPDAAQPEAAQP